MNSTISTFMKIAITVGAIALLLFGAAYTMVSQQVGETGSVSGNYKAQITKGDSKLPSGF